MVATEAEAANKSEAEPTGDGSYDNGKLQLLSLETLAARVDLSGLEIGRASSRDTGDFLRILHPHPDDVFEVRILGIRNHNSPRATRNRTASGYFKVGEIATAVGQIAGYAAKKPKGIYVTVNPVMPELLARTGNQILEAQSCTTTDSDVRCRRFLFVDVDARRRAGISATDEEQRSAFETAQRIRLALNLAGFPDPLEVSSGNGWHLYYLIDLPNDPASTGLISDCLKALATAFDTEKASVDPQTFNAARIARVVNTFAAKGVSIDDRPHRIASFRPVERSLQSVSRDQLEWLANQYVPPSITSIDPCEADAATSHDIEKRVRSYLETMDPAIEGQNGSNKMFHAAAIVAKFGIPECDASRVLQEFNNRCEPPWSANELNHKIHDAYANVHKNGEFAAKVKITRSESTQANGLHVAKDPSLSQIAYEPGARVVAGDRGNVGEVVADCGASCQVRFVSKDGNVAIKTLPKSELRDLAGLPDNDDSSPPFQPMSARELDEAELHTNYLIDGILVERQLGMLAGASKCLKTGLAVDIAISLASGTPFLGDAKVIEKRRVLLATGESGLPTIQETARRNAASRGMFLSDLEDNLHVIDAVPRVTRLKRWELFKQLIKDTDSQFCIVDPLYLALDGAEAHNVFQMGEQLERFTELANELQLTILLVHHTRKLTVNASEFQPLELTDMSAAGVAEFARQWLLVSRRERYDPDSTVHRLWISAGGSAGHSRLIAADIDEGRLSDPQGRKWDVTVTSAADARDEASKSASRRREEAAAAKREATQRERVQKVIEAFHLVKDHKLTKTDIRDRAGLSGEASNAAIAEMLRHEQLEPCLIRKSNGQEYPGYRVVWEKLNPHQEGPK